MLQSILGSTRALQRAAFVPPVSCRSHASRCVQSRALTADSGDFVSVHYTGILDNGDVFDSSRQDGREPLQFEVGSGQVVKGFDALVTGLAEGESRKERISPEDAYGNRSDELVLTVPGEAAPSGLEVGAQVQLSNGLRAVVTDVSDGAITIDANPPLAGKHLTFDVELVRVIKPDQLGKMTFGAGCFWGPELAFQRVPGVLKTEVGYCNGHVEGPTYEQVCSGQTGHAEVVQVTYSRDAVSVHELCETMYSSLKDPTQVNGQGNDIGSQHRTGIYYHTEEQKAAAEAFLAAKQAEQSGNVAIELKAVDNYSAAEEYHQQYLAKGGRNGRAQNPAKGCTDPIRCYG